MRRHDTSNTGATCYWNTAHDKVSRYGQNLSPGVSLT
jgi:hypothetical protein